MSGLKMKVGSLAMMAVLGVAVSAADANYLRWDFNVDGAAPEDAQSYSFGLNPGEVDPNVQRQYSAGNIESEVTSGGVYDVDFNTGGFGTGYLAFAANLQIQGPWQITWEGSVGTGQADTAASNSYWWRIGSVATSYELRMAYFNDNGVDKTKVYYNNDVYVIDDIDTHTIQLRSNLNGIGQYINASLLVDGVEVATTSNFVGFVGSSGVGSTQWGHTPAWSNWDAQINKVYFESGDDLTVVPEPASLGLMLAGGLMAFRRQRKA